MELEGKGQVQDAALCFARAWDSSTNDFERCIAAHYLARHQKSPAEALRWNQESLRYADASDDASVREFYPSLYLNLGKSYEDLGNRDEARKFYELAGRSAAVLPTNGYGALVRSGIASGLQRVGHS
jgi:tetratricopeptide (TPR) repeat protein